MLRIIFETRAELLWLKKKHVDYLSGLNLSKGSYEGSERTAELLAMLPMRESELL